MNEEIEWTERAEAIFPENFGDNKRSLWDKMTQLNVEMKSEVRLEQQTGKREKEGCWGYTMHKNQGKGNKKPLGKLRTKHPANVEF